LSGAAPPTQVGRFTTIVNALANRPELIRAVTWPLVRFAPTIATRKRAVVTRHADALEVLDRDGDFTVAEINGVSMDLVNGPFVLGMDRSPLHDRERAILAAAVKPGDLDVIRATVRGNAADLVEAARSQGRIDVVRGLARPAATRLVASYLGVPGPDEATMMRWLRAGFYETFLNVGDDPVVRRWGTEAGAALHRCMDGLIAQRKADQAAGAATPDDLLDRLIHMQADPDTALSDEGVRRNLGGVVVGAVDTTSKAVAHAVDQLLRRPEALEAARNAALADDVETVGRFAFEALRFNPINPVLARFAARDTEVAAGTPWKHRIFGGSTVYVAILPAMFDPRVFHQPGQFRADRPSSSYLHFGAGLHACYGRYINLIQIPELLAALLRLDDLRRADSTDGQIRYDGPFPDRFELEFRP
jgi:cytochrome P450